MSWRMGAPQEASIKLPWSWSLAVSSQAPASTPRPANRRYGIGILSKAPQRHTAISNGRPGFFKASITCEWKAA